MLAADTAHKVTESWSWVSVFVLMVQEWEGTEQVDGDG